MHARATPEAIAWLQRALGHEFAAARQFTLQAALAGRLARPALAAECERAAADELRHARQLADALLAAGVPLAAAVAAAVLPVGHDVESLLRHARETEERAVRLYRDAARRCPGAIRPLFEALGEEEAAHLAEIDVRWRALADSRRQ
jgi:bacterioferritin (cytochrome b1)